jgi:chromosomal replication initiator protein
MTQEIEFNIHDKDLILEETSKYFGIMINAIMGRSRKREIVVARQSSMYMIKKSLGDIISLKSIGQFHGKRDHSTVIHAITTIDDLIYTDREFKLKIAGLKEKIKEAKLEKEKELDRQEAKFKFEMPVQMEKNLEVLEEVKNCL